jgi:DNA-binding transcriptional regulator YhcF (GntR family)
MDQIFEIDCERKTPKYIQIINSVTKSIKQGKLKKGDRILSINELSAAFYLSRDTVQKAYDLLEERGIILPVRGKGFYINRTDVTGSYRVLLLFNKISNYKKLVYNSFVETLGKDAVVDIKIHHSNGKIFESLIDTYKNDYDYYVVMPHFYENADEAFKLIKQLPADKLILLDKELDDTNENCAAVYQDFKTDIITALESGKHLLIKYRRLILVFPTITHYPAEIALGFKKFCIQHNFDYAVIPEIGQCTPVYSQEAYIVIEETDLVSLIKTCRNKKLVIGEDVGIISYNDTPLKEILLDGITVVSTDHNQMGETAALLIMGNRREKIKNPFKLIIRESL